MSINLRNMFLMTLTKEPEYMKVNYKYFPRDIREKYALDSIQHNGHIYCKIKKGMYQLKQAAVLAFNQLSKLLRDADYTPIIGSNGMWKHSTRSILFNLCVDDFGIKYFHKEDVQHLINTINKIYDVKTDWSGSNFLGYTL